MVYTCAKMACDQWWPKRECERRSGRREHASYYLPPTKNNTATEHPPNTAVGRVPEWEMITEMTE